MPSPCFCYRERLDDIALPQVGELMGDIRPLPIAQVNWPSVSPYKPESSVKLAYSDKALYVLFVVESECVKAIQTKPQSPVCQDSCVEFFMRLPGEREYWNFEFNAIGTINASRRERRDRPTRLTEQELSTIGRWSSLGNEPLDERAGETQWSLTVRIPLALLGISIQAMPTHLYANFYKCGDKTSRPHYVSWSPIHSDRPNFHRIEDFAPIIFDKP